MSPSVARLSSSGMKTLMSHGAAGAQLLQEMPSARSAPTRTSWGEQGRKQGGDFLGCCSQAFLLHILQGNGFAKACSANFLFFTGFAYSRALHYLFCYSVCGNASAGSAHPANTWLFPLGYFCKKAVGTHSSEQTLTWEMLSERYWGEKEQEV